MYVCLPSPPSHTHTGNAASFRARIHQLLTTGVRREDDEHGDKAMEDKVHEDEEAGRIGGALDRSSSRHGGVDGGGDDAMIQHVLIDACAMRILDLTALGTLAEVMEEAGDMGVSVVMTNLTHALKRSLESCDLLERLGGPLVTMSTEEVSSVHFWAGLLVRRTMSIWCK